MVGIGKVLAGSGKRFGILRDPQRDRKLPSEISPCVRPEPRRRTPRELFRSLPIALLLLIVSAANHAQAAQPEQGILEVRIKDHRDAIDDFAQLIVTIDKIAVSPKPGVKFWQTGWKEFAVTSEPVDLTKYVGKPTAQLFRALVATGAFDAFHLQIKNIAGLLKKKQRKVPVKNTIGKFKLDYEIRPNAVTLLILDLVVSDMSDHPPRGYELSLKGYELYLNDKLIEKIPPG